MPPVVPSPSETVDVVLLTALHEEYLEVLEVHDGAIDPGWTQRPDGPFDRYVARRRFAGTNGSFTVVAAWAAGMGGTDAAGMAGMLLERFHPRCLVMTGIAAGHRGKVALGDVVFGHRLFTHDTGKHVATGSGADSKTVLKGDLNPYRLDASWKHRVEMFLSENNGNLEREPPPWAERPMTLERQGEWVLARFLAGEQPREHPERKLHCPDWKATIERLRKQELVSKSGIALTDEGRHHAQDYEDLHPDGPAPAAPVRLHLGDIASGNAVIEDGEVFARIGESMRKTIGLEMEAAAIAAVGHLGGVPTLIAKGICDFADEDKDDHFHRFAARASAESVLGFLRAHTDLLGDRGGPDAKVKLDPGYVELPENPAPSQYLVARYGVVEFTGRQQELAELDAWAERPGAVGVRLIHGPGGAGKTRLLLEWVKRRRNVGEHAGFLRDDVDDAVVEWLGKAEQATVVIDYAETRVGLFGLLRGLAPLRSEAAPRRVRVVLLARNAGDWWDSLRERDDHVKELLADAPLPLSLESLVPLEERAAEFSRAAASFAERPGRRMPSEVPALDDLRFGRALYLHMAAFAAVEDLAVSIDQLLGGLLEHEGRFWLRRTGLSGGDTDPDQVLDFLSAARASVGAITLRGRVDDEDQVVAIVGRFSRKLDEKLIWKLVRLARELYPHPTDGWIAGLEPDLLGEALVRKLLADRAWPRWIYDASVDANTKVWTHAFTVLGRVEEAEPTVADRYPLLLDGHVAARGLPAFEALLALGTRTAFSRLGLELAKGLAEEGSVELAASMDGRVPEKTTMLREIAVWVDEMLLGEVEDDEARGSRLNNLGNRLSELGRMEEAVKAAEEAVAVRRRLAQARPDAFLSDLAMSLGNLGNRLSALGRMEEALKATEEAVAVGRRLAQARPVAFLPGLARGLTGLGNKLLALGRREEAVKAAEEAVAVFRTQAQARPDAFLPDLSLCLNNLGHCLSALGRREEALKATEEAVSVFRVQAQAHPDAFLPSLASSLNNLGHCLSALGRREEALKATEEAVAVKRRLAQARPDAFLPDLATSLTGLSDKLSVLGRREEALKATEEAVAVFRTQAQARPDAFLPHLAVSLNNLGYCLSGLGRREEALKATEEAVAVRRTLAEARPDAFLPDLATSLCNLGNSLSALGRMEEALKATEEAVGVRRTFAEAHPDTFLPDLALSLNNLGTRLSALGRSKEAVKATEEAVAVRRTLAEARPVVYLPDLATSLTNLAIWLSALGRREEAVKANEEAVAVYRTLAEARPDAFLPDLAMSLTNLGIWLLALGRREGALKATEEAVAVRRTLAEARPDAFLPDLARSLGAHGSALQAMGRTTEAAGACDEALDHIWNIFEQSPQALAQLTATLLRDQAAALGPQAAETMAGRLERFKELLSATRSTTPS